MNRQRLFGVGAVVLLLVALVGIKAANAWVSAPQMMYITFSSQVALPGVTLPAGTYIFERADPVSRNDVVRVLARDRSKVYLQAFTIQVSRPEGMPRDRMITFHESQAGAAPRIDAWFPQYESVGHRFRY
jgi:hypothetical protein